MSSDISVTIAVTEEAIVTTIQAPPDAYLHTYLAVGRCVRELTQRPTEVPHFNYDVTVEQK